jgi:hypothetical protein
MRRPGPQKEGLTRRLRADPYLGGVSFTGQTVMAFSHPLARAAKVWTAKANDGAEQRVLVIITTIPLEPNDKGYKKSLVERLSRAARDYLAESKDASSYVLANRTRDWKLGNA